jgi:putative transposase
VTGFTANAFTDCLKASEFRLVCGWSRGTTDLYLYRTIVESLKYELIYLKAFEDELAYLTQEGQTVWFRWYNQVRHIGD